MKEEVDEVEARGVKGAVETIHRVEVIEAESGRGDGAERFVARWRR